MASAASDWFETAESPSGWSYALRSAARTPMHFPGIFLFVIVGLTVVGAGNLGHGVSRNLSSGRGAERSLAVLLPLPFLAPGGALAIYLLRRRTGRDELRLEPEAIRAIWRLGLIAWSKTVPRSTTVQLTVVRRSWYESADLAWVGRRDHHALVAEDETGRRRTLVAYYPREMLLALAVELSSRLKPRFIDPDLDGIGAGKLAVGEDSEISTDLHPRNDPPRGTRLIFERTGRRGVRIAKPPDGFFSVGFVFLLCMGVGLPVLAIALAVPQILGLNEDPLIARVFTWIFVALSLPSGVICLLGAVGAATSSYVLTATAHSLTLEEKSLGPPSCKTWKRQEIASICADTKIEISGNNEGGKWVTTRVLIRTTGSIKSEPDELVSAAASIRTKQEMEWIATTLRAVLGVPATDAPTGNAIPAGSDEPKGRRRPR
jgi:hypothetical protein